MKIITISREFGSGGRTVGHKVAERLGIPFYDKELVNQVALESGFAPKFVEEHGEHSPSSSLFSYAFAPQGVPGVMNGLSTADFLWNMAFRADRIVRLYGESDKSPEARLNEKDKRRRVNYQHYTGRTWGQSQNYDICLNSGVLGIDQCVDIIVGAVENSKK